MHQATGNRGEKKWLEYTKQWEKGIEIHNMIKKDDTNFHYMNKDKFED